MILLYIIFSVCLVAGTKVPTIGIIGGGIGGTSCAYFLRQLFGENNANITLFEFNKIGGRLATEELGGDFYEVGGAVIHPRNEYMVNFVKAFGLKRRNNEETSAFGLYNGEEFVFSEDSESWQIWNALKLLWRYGYDVLKLKYFIDDMLDNFSRIYTFQHEGKAYESVEEMLAAMNKKFSEYLFVSSKVGFEENGFSERLINELILATLLVNYGQTTNVHQFVGSVSVAGGTPGLWAVEGGNRLVAEKLVKAASASVIKGQVATVTLKSDGRFQVSYINQKGNISLHTFDFVILAAPVADNIEPKIQFLNFPVAFNFTGKYHQTICSVIRGEINNKFFGFEPNKIQEILSINSSLFFNSFGKIYPVNSQKKCDKCSTWKVFSHSHIKKNILKKLFVNIEEIKVIPWLAYPHYSTSLYHQSFVLHKNFFYINAIEWAASAMEMSAISAKNAALLAHNSWFNISRSSSKHSKKEDL